MSLEGLELECYKMSCEIDNLVAEVERLKQVNEMLNYNIQQHIKWNETHTKRIVELSDENEELRSSILLKMSSEMDILVVEVERLKKENEELKERYPKFPENDIVPQCADCRLIYDKCHSEIKQLKEEVEAYKLKEKICSDCECNPEYLRWKRENEQLKKDVEGWKKAYTDMHDAQWNSVKVIREWEKENKQLKEALEIKTEHVEQCINNLDKFEKEIEQLKEALKDVINIYKNIEVQVSPKQYIKWTNALKLIGGEGA